MPGFRRGGEREHEYFKRAERDLGEAELIAGRGSMLVWQIEAALERTRLALAVGEGDEARRKLEETRALVKQTEKPYEPPGATAGLSSSVRGSRMRTIHRLRIWPGVGYVLAVTKRRERRV